MSVTSRFHSPVSRHSFVSPETLTRVKAWLGPRVMFGFRLAASVCLTLTITYSLQLQNSFWAATTAAIVCQPNLGASLQKGRYRVVGTLTGALVMVALLGLLAQDRDMLVLSLAVFCGLCGFAAVALRGFASYAAALAGITATIIFADNPERSHERLPAVAHPRQRDLHRHRGHRVRDARHRFRSGGAPARRPPGADRGQVATGFVASLACMGDTDEMRGGAACDHAILGPPQRRDRRRDRRIRATPCPPRQSRAARGTLIAALVGWRNVGHHPHQLVGDDPAMRTHLAALVRSLGVDGIGRDPVRVKTASVEALRHLHTMDCPGSLDWLLGCHPRRRPLSRRDGGRDPDAARRRRGTADAAENRAS